ncbi:hypothetical protein AYL99_11157 [Fonsecaea erecta]|uniref:Uncharacterized protein n=1 Tax=Fonsecaea erecta TaxID=1367422 RepID=A0A178Z4N3_9EURO|nr:hypothetical protein AYL99_11157 [Fonsecaea erecta]OAP54709.1 hypothetical protein AYL99_11157 [Fonsecaea erecta]
MRLLERKPNGDLAFQEFTREDVPAYAILSHTWLTDNNEEISFHDVEAGTGKGKAGWKKIEFCADKASADGLRYFWIDTCCIDKRNNTELSKAINSMFRWYQKATRCYAYLTDVSLHDGKETPQLGTFPWEAAFKKSRWFTRGWTLQELLAPPRVDFFSLEGEQLGSKLTLQDLIHDITGIPSAALKGAPLETFSRGERMSWASGRRTKEEEDQAYCLLGIFDVSMPLVYGEGKERAYKRLQDEIDKTYRGHDSDQFVVGLDHLAIPEAAQFVARENELAEMRRLLRGHNPRSAVVLHGLGGIGKTQLAIKYITQHRERYTAIFWLNANDEGSLKSSFRNVAQRVLEDQGASVSIGALASVDLDGNLDQVVTAVNTWLNLKTNTRWLMIYDNYDNPRTAGNLDPSAVDIRQFLPRADHGSIIITTRSAQVSQGYPLHIRKLQNIQESLEILSNTSKRGNIQNDRGAIALVRELDGLPLALSAAGAYLQHVTTGFSDYLRLYRRSWLRLQMKSPQLSSYEDRSLYTTWQITFDRIERQNAAAAKLLQWWAYFDRQDVWFELLRHASSADDEWVQKLAEDELNFNEAVTLLCSFGLVDIDRSLSLPLGSGKYSVHSCVHSWTVSVLNQKWDEGLARLALTCVASEVPRPMERDCWLLQRRLLQHATRQDLFLVDDKVNTDGLEWAFLSLGHLYVDQGKLAEAEKMYLRALQGYEGALGPDHTSTLLTVNNFGNLYMDQGKLAEAEKMYLRALQGCEEALGPDHTSTLLTVHNLGNLYMDQGKLAEAEKMYLRALQGCEEALGPDHTSTLLTVNNLGNLYMDQGKLAEAEKMCLRALQGKEEALGPDHTSTLDTVHNLGNLYMDQGKLAEAEKMYLRALQGKEEALGPDHTSTLNTANNLGNLYRDQGKLAEAEKIYLRALQGYEEALGPDHTSTLNTVHNLGNIYMDQGKLAEAEKMYLRALQGCEEALGPDHTSTLDTVHNLGNLYMNQGKLAEAEKMYLRALQGYQGALGVELISSYLPAINTMFAFGELYSRTDRKDMAKKMYSRALSGYAAVQGPSSKWCRVIEGRLHALQSTSAERAETHVRSRSEQRGQNLVYEESSAD